MPCTSSEGMGSAYSEDPSARRSIEELRRALDDHADTLCYMRELVLSLLMGTPPNPTDFDRLVERIDKHRAFDRSQGRAR